MKNSELIAKLQEYPADMEVAVFDWQQNGYDDTGDGSLVGIHPDFEIDRVNSDDEIEAFKELYPDEPQLKPWIALLFVNHDYDEDVIALRNKENYVSRSCRVCGCTDADCSQCIQKTGKPCHWVEEDLCSACQGLIILP